MKKLILFGLLFLYHTPALGEDTFSGYYTPNERVQAVKPVTNAPVRTGHRRYQQPSRYKITPYHGPVIKPVTDPRAPLKLPDGVVKPNPVSYQLPLAMVGLIQYHKDWFVPVIPVDARPLPPVFQTPLKAVVTVIGGASLAVFFSAWCFVRREQLTSFFKGAWNEYYDTVEFVTDTTVAYLKSATAGAARAFEQLSPRDQYTSQAEAAERRECRAWVARHAVDHRPVRSDRADTQDERAFAGTIPAE